MTPKTLIGVALVAASILLPATAHADANTTYFNCLHDNGYIVTNQAQALKVAVAVQNDELNNLNRDQILWNLEHLWGIDYDKSNTIIDCAYQTLMSR